MAESESRIAELDGLRGAAILLVLVCHFTIYGVAQPDSGAARLVYKAAQSGWVGVDLFFVLSGFLITGILYRAKGTQRFFANFYARRALRIFPLYFGFLAIAVGLLPWLRPDDVRLQGWLRESPWYWTYTGNVLTALHGWSPSAVQGLNHFWSLAVEEQFYLLWPLAVFFLNRRQLIGVCVGAAVGSLALRILLVGYHHNLAGYVLTPTRMDALAAGAFVALVLQGPTRARDLRRYACWTFAACGLALGVIALLRRTNNPEDAVIETLGYGCLAGLFAALLTFIVTSPGSRAVRPLNWSAARWLGRYSYGLYVLHHPLLFLLPPSAVAAVLHGYIADERLAQAVALVLVFGVCAGLAMASWRWVEQPILSYKTRFSAPPAPIPARAAA